MPQGFDKLSPNGVRYIGNVRGEYKCWIEIRGLICVNV
jgi:hypothetical protein